MQQTYNERTNIKRRRDVKYGNMPLRNVLGVDWTNTYHNLDMPSNGRILFYLFFSFNFWQIAVTNNEAANF